MKKLTKMTTQEQFEENCEFSPYLSENKRKDDVSVSFQITDNRIGEEILSLTLVNPPERFKDSYFYGSPEWMKIKPEMVKTLYHFYSLLF